MASKELTEKFINGLKNYNLSFDDIGNWAYCGGTSGRHKNYFNLRFPNKEIPSWTNKCVCGHTITENCYITNEERFLVLGNCCIKKFIPASTRTCENQNCRKPHKNRIVNRCNECRIGVCDKCNRGCSEQYKTCASCHFK